MDTLTKHQLQQAEFLVSIAKNNINPNELEQNKALQIAVKSAKEVKNEL